MHRAARQRPLPPHHAFTPVPQQTSALQAAPGVMGTQDSHFNVHRQRAASWSSFAPATAFHPAPLTSFSSRKGRWAALHVCIAWKIYYHKTFKKIPQKPNVAYGTCPSGSESDPRQALDQPSCSLPVGLTQTQVEFPCGESGIRSMLSKAALSSTCHPSGLHASSHSLPTTQWEEVTQHEKHTAHQADTAEGSPLGDKARGQRVSGEHRVTRKRRLEHDAFVQAKRLKMEPLDDTLDSSKTFHTDPSWFSMSHAHHGNMGHVSLFYPHSSTAFAGPDISPYQAAPRELLWSRREHLRSRQPVLKENSARPLEALGGFLMPPLYFLPALGAQEASYLSGRELLHTHPENCHSHPCRRQLPHSGFLTTSC